LSGGIAAFLPAFLAVVLFEAIPSEQERSNEDKSPDQPRL
jgi:hypothetical protein